MVEEDIQLVESMQKTLTKDCFLGYRMTAQAVTKWQKNKSEEPSWSDREKYRERQRQRQRERLK